MAGNEVRVEVREKDVRDAEMMIRSERQVLIDVTLRIDDGRRPRVLVPDEIRRMREAIQIELFEDHRVLLIRRAAARSFPASATSMRGRARRTT